jgi:GT2 family glycosyltransferase
MGACLDAILTAAGNCAQPVEVIVVENGSSDGTSELIQREYPSIELVALAENRGFAGGVQEALMHCRGEWVALVNNDATLDPHALLHMVHAAEQDARIGSVNPQLRFEHNPEVLNSAGLEIDQLGIVWPRLVGEPLARSEGEPTEIFGVEGCVALYRRAMLDDIQGFDASFFMYMEDADVAWRARMKGWRSVYAPAAVAYHHHSTTARHGSDFKYYLVGRNRVRLLAKNATRGLLLRRGLAMLLYDAAYVAYVAAAERTAAPLKGRMPGLLEFRRYRRLGADGRRPVQLVPAGGVRRALQRYGVWRAAGSGAA